LSIILLLPGCLHLNFSPVYFTASLSMCSSASGPVMRSTTRPLFRRRCRGLPVGDCERDPWVPSGVSLLEASDGCVNQHIPIILINPHRRDLRRAVRVHRRQKPEVPALNKPPCLGLHSGWWFLVLLWIVLYFGWIIHPRHVCGQTNLHPNTPDSCRLYRGATCLPHSHTPCNRHIHV
jgi:hypothetical protein